MLSADNFTRKHILQLQEEGGAEALSGLMNTVITAMESEDCKAIFFPVP